jgi:hypothetical protein
MSTFFFSKKSWNSLYYAEMLVDVVASPEVGVA